MDSIHGWIEWKWKGKEQKEKREYHGWIVGERERSRKESWIIENWKWKEGKVKEVRREGRRVFHRHSFYTPQTHLGPTTFLIAWPDPPLNKAPESGLSNILEYFFRRNKMCTWQKEEYRFKCIFRKQSG